MNWIDFVGYTASFFVVLSFLIKQNVSRIRLVNLVGCVLFVIYGIYINSIPIIVPNAFFGICAIVLPFTSSQKG
ncbi:uroporphyrinogen decarboxylase [Capnocytophaga canimorsus]|nr:uroporphyrinogen decarboxylase [Capnocytophaga canimorsus]WGU68505.1 uroporphyrinogen decarboxylase [Capnocytophaga canimorsus]